MKEKGFVIYPGKISQADTFRIGNIGDVFPEDFSRLIEAIKTVANKNKSKLYGSGAVIAPEFVSTLLPLQDHLEPELHDTEILITNLLYMLSRHHPAISQLHPYMLIHVIIHAQ